MSWDITANNSVVKSERRAVIIIMVVTAFLCNFAVENGEARLYLGKSRTSSWTIQAAKPITALHSACTDFAARNKSN